MIPTDEQLAQKTANLTKQAQGAKFSGKNLNQEESTVFTFVQRVKNDDGGSNYTDFIISVITVFVF